MSQQLTRNSPCSCGSGKKYKNCCLPLRTKQETRLQGEYKFEPGSYPYEERYLPSIACLELTKGDRWQYLFLILKLTTSFTSPDEAAQISIEDLQKAMEYEQSDDSKDGMAGYLKSIGYENASSCHLENIDSGE